jgi:hypothetical protein
MVLRKARYGQVYSMEKTVHKVFSYLKCGHCIHSFFVKKFDYFHIFVDNIQ